MSRIEEEMGEQDGGSDEDGEDGDRKGKAERGERRGGDRGETQVHIAAKTSKYMSVKILERPYSYV